MACADTMFSKILFILLVYDIMTVESSKILGIFHRPSKSHHSLGTTLFKALASRGHQVTMVSPFPLKASVENYEDIELTGMEQFYEENNVMKKYIKIQKLSRLQQVTAIMETANTVNERVLNHIAIKNLMASNRTFDLVILSWSMNEAFLGLTQRLANFTIGFSTIGSSFVTNRVTVNPAPLSYVPGLVSLLPDEMTFYQRVVNTVSSTLIELIYNIRCACTEEEILKRYFPTAPPLKELLSNVPLVLLNTHFSIESPRPYGPNMIQVGGLHIQEPKELKGDLKEFMDSASNGVIFFSLGSNVKISDLPEDKLEAITKTFAKLPTKILWKCETDNVPGLPSNVKIGKWFPQTDILAHPNVKLFVTHGGLLSTIESVYRGVPMVGIPFFGDQESNVDDGVNKGYLIKVHFLELSERRLTNAINEVLNNPKYRKNVQWRSMVLKDQPLKPLDKAVFWTEYVLRHKGAHHLKTSAIKLEWYQLYLLDVISFLAGTVLVICLSCYFILCAAIKFLRKMVTKKLKTA